MNKRDAFAKVWALLDGNEKRNFYIVLVIIIVGALSSAVMVGSVLPFLAVLSDPTKIQTVAILRWGYDTFGFTSDYAFLLALGIGSLLTIVAVNLLQILKVYATSRFVQMRLHSISNRLLSLHLAQPYEVFLNRHTGKLAQSILAEAGQVVTGFLRPATDVIAASLTIAAIVGLLIWVDYRVALGAFLVLGSVYVMTFTVTRPRLSQLGRKRARLNEARFRVANEAFGGIKDLKILGREAAYRNAFGKPSLAMSHVMVRQTLLANLPPYFVLPIGYGGIILICLLLMDRDAYESGVGNLGNILPVLGVFAFAGQRLLPELSRLYQYLSQMQGGIGAVESITQDFEDLRAVEELPETPPAPLGLRRELTLQDVTYRYPNSEKGGVTDLSLTIRAGEKIGIVGSTGAGKTTFADIVLGLLRPTSGALHIDGISITEDNLRSWQQSVGYVPQSIFLSDVSIARNIAFGVPDSEIDADRVRSCARMAQLESFIDTQLADGFDTVVGERGVRLSGGQRQRIGIARALYHNADLILFDEATSALDNATERDVMTAVQALPGDKTILMIAHRLSTVRICDRILVLENGQVVSFAPWDELMECSPAFQNLVNNAQDI